jgi:ribosomal protein S20
MPIKKRSISVLKNIRQNRRRYVANLTKKKALKAAVKDIKRSKTKAEGLKKYPKVQAIIDKSVQDGIIKKNTAARMKSRLLVIISHIVKVTKTRGKKKAETATEEPKETAETQEK